MIASVLIAVLSLSGALLYVAPSPTLTNVAILLLHLGGGVAFAATVTVGLIRGKGHPFHSKPASFSVTLGSVLGAALIFTGTAGSFSAWLSAHIGLSVLGVTLLVSTGLGRAGWLSRSPGRTALRFGVVLVATVALCLSLWATRELGWQNEHRIENPPMPPSAMEEEGDGPSGLFFPSAARTSDGGRIPAKFFMGSDQCARCHADIYEQWASSAHRFSSFNNQWYRKSIEYMQDVIGVTPSKWCGGCHDPALLFSGMMDTPVRKIVDLPEAHAGLGCVMCHSVTEVEGTMGQGGYTLDYPDLYNLATSENRLVRAAHDFVVRVNPEPHRRTFMKPFMRGQTAEFCSSCHKVHLDGPVNQYRWIRGFNDYDNWQASGVSGEGARSFYYPPEPMDCVDCHMPLVASDDSGSRAGRVHSHRFPAANTALPTANQDREQLAETIRFLTDDVVSVDIFAMSPARAEIQTASLPAIETATTFAVGEESPAAAVSGIAPDAVPVTAPLDRVAPVLRRGDTFRVDVVVRTRKVGHFFPAGTVDAFDVWLELIATDDKDQVLFWSGKVEDNGRGPVEGGAHFYRSLSVDAHGNPINKRNAWAARALVYARLIPPGAADTVHYRVHIPETIGDEINLEARLHYRKFSWWNTGFSYAGVRDPDDNDSDVTPHHDDGSWLFTGDVSGVSGSLKRIPELPRVTMAEDTLTLRVMDADPDPHTARVVLEDADWERWNDYGIGLLLQGDLKGAEAAFLRTTEIAPDNVDGWVNIGRARVREGNLDGAGEVLERALELDPELARANFFYAQVLRAEGQFDEALAHLEVVTNQYPRDRVARNETGRILFLERRYQEAVDELKAVLRIDPEDLRAHYNLMLSYNGLGDEESALEHQQRYLRFKADESAQAITGPYRLDHPEDNNERQPIHEHVSIALDGIRKAEPVRDDTGGTP